MSSVFHNTLNGNLVSIIIFYMKLRVKQKVKVKIVE